MHKLWNSNKGGNRVFLSRNNNGDSGKDVGAMRRHNLEICKQSKLELTRSGEQLIPRVIDKGSVMTPQDTTFQSHDVVFKVVAKEKKGMLARFYKSRTESQASLSGHSPRRLCSLEGETDIEEYARREWQTQKPNAIKMKKGYSRIKERGFPHIRRVRGDNYCALRSVLFQLLTFCDVTQPILPLYPSLAEAMRRLDDLWREQSVCLAQWSFGQNFRLRERSTAHQALRGCVETFYQTYDKLKTVPAGGARRDLLAQELNSRDRDQFLETDARLVEFIKFLMFSQAADLYRRQGAGEDVPLWFLLFSLRDNSASLAEFFHYHLNLVGDSLGLEQIEMFLLGRALNVRIRAFRLKSLGEDDFETLYPPMEDTFLPQETPIVPLSAEDDRHYNVVY